MCVSSVHQCTLQCTPVYVLVYVPVYVGLSLEISTIIAHAGIKNHLLFILYYLRGQRLVLNYCGNLHRKPNVHWDVHWNVHWRTLERTLAYTGKTGGFGHGAQNASGLALMPPRRQECARARADAASLSSSAQKASRHALDAMSQNVGGLARAPPRGVHAARDIYIYIYTHIHICIYACIYGFVYYVWMYICISVWWIVSAPRQRLASVLGLLLSDKSSHHFRDLYLWLVFVLASPVPPRVQC